MMLVVNEIIRLHDANAGYPVNSSFRISGEWKIRYICILEFSV